MDREGNTTFVFPWVGLDEAVLVFGLIASTSCIERSNIWSTVTMACWLVVSVNNSRRSSSSRTVVFNVGARFFEGLDSRSL